MHFVQYYDYNKIKPKIPVYIQYKCQAKPIGCHVTAPYNDRSWDGSVYMWTSKCYSSVNTVCGLGNWSWGGHYVARMRPEQSWPSDKEPFCWWKSSWILCTVCAMNYLCGSCFVMFYCGLVWVNFTYRQVSNIRRTKSQYLKYSRTVLRLSFRNPLKPDVKSRMKM